MLIVAFIEDMAVLMGLNNDPACIVKLDTTICYDILLGENANYVVNLNYIKCPAICGTFYAIYVCSFSCNHAVMDVLNVSILSSYLSKVYKILATVHSECVMLHRLHPC